jgi:hypothetical protein
VTGYQWFQNVFVPLFEPGEGSRFIALHESAVADDVGGQYGGQSSLNAVFSHEVV